MSSIASSTGQPKVPCRYGFTRPCAAGSLAASPECLAYELSRCHDEPRRYVLRIEWRSLEGHEHGFRRGPHFAGFLAEVRPFIGEVEHMKHYHRTGVRSGATEPAS